MLSLAVWPAPPLMAAIDFGALTPTLWVALLIALGMLLWDTIEVGRNDAANMVNAVFGARVLTRRTAGLLAGVGVILGAASSSPVMETARKGIFDPGALTIEKALAVYISVYIVDTVLLYGYTVFGMPVSTTASLVFELLGAAFVLGGFGVIHWHKAGTIILAIICSIFIAGIAAFLIQRAVRGAVRDRTQNLTVLLAHGGWIGGAMLAGLTYFMLVKGMKNVEFVKRLNHEVIEAYGAGLVVFALWAFFAIVIHMLLVLFGKRAARLLFPSLAILGTLAMAFAFGQNDLANCASPGLAAVYLIQHWDEGAEAASKIPIPVWTLAACGVLLGVGIMTRAAHRVTSAAVHSGSMAHSVRLWAPGWCLRAARLLLRFRRPRPVLAPAPAVTTEGKVLHFDVLRACVILAVSASVIATASGFGLPVSTTYVAFAAIVATGLADRILQRGDADLKLARTIWVIFSWFAAAVIAAVATGLVAWVVYSVGWVGMLLGLAANLLLRTILKRRADMQEARIREATRERVHPELFAEYEG